MVKPTEPSNGEPSEVSQHIARVASQLFATRGYDATPVRVIAEAAGVTKPTLYYHFGSKEGLAQSLLSTPLLRQAEALREVVEGTTDPTRVLERWAEVHFAFCREDPDRVRFVYALFFGPLNTGLSAELAKMTRVFDESLLSAVRRAAEAGVVDPDRIEGCMAAVRGVVVIHMMDHLYRGGRLGPDLAARLVGDLLRGFAPPGASRDDRGSGGSE